MRDCPELKIIALCSALLLSACVGSGPSHKTEVSPGRTAGVAAATPQAAQQRYDAALKLLQDGERDAAREALLALTRDYPQYSGPFTDLGILHARQRQRDAAIAAFREAVRLNPQNTVAWNWLGTQYREHGQFAAAEQAYRAAIAARPDEAAAYLNLAILNDVSLHRPQIALQAYRDYQQRAGSEARPIVAVWIRELEARGGGPGLAVAEAAVAQR